MTSSFPEALLSGVNKYSTTFGYVRLSVVCVFRVLVFVLVVQPVWEDNSKDFDCNTLDADCSSMCYDHTFPISHIHLWAFRLILITCPSLMLACYIQFQKKKRQCHLAVQEDKHLYATSKKKHGDLWWTYLLSQVFKATIDAGFIFILFYIYKGFDLPHLIQCDIAPCSNRVDCYLSHPTEKKISTIFMVASSSLCILLCVIEMIYLVCKRCNKVCHERKQERMQLFDEQNELRAHFQLRCECEVISIALP